MAHTALTEPAIHVDETKLSGMEVTVFKESPELHARHNESVVRIVVVSKATVEQVNTMKTCHMSSDDERNLVTYGQYIRTYIVAL